LAEVPLSAERVGRAPLPPPGVLVPVPPAGAVPVVAPGWVVWGTVVVVAGVMTPPIGASPGRLLPPATALPAPAGVGSNMWVHPMPASHTSGHACAS